MVGVSGDYSEEKQHIWLSPCLSKKVPLCAQVTFPLSPKTKGDFFFVGVFWFSSCLNVGGLQKPMSASASMLPAACTPAHGFVPMEINAGVSGKGLPPALTPSCANHLVLAK